MANKKLYRLLVNMFIITCLIGLVAQVGLAMPFLSQVWALDNLKRDVEPILVAPLSGCEYVTPNKPGEFKLSDVELHQAHGFVKVCPSVTKATFRYYGNQQNIADNRLKIRYLIISHFHGSRYKDVIPLS